MPFSALPGLSEWCAENEYLLKDIGPEEASLNDRESGNVWSLFRVGSWVQVKARIIEDIDASHAVCLTLARLHERLLGCRFSVDEDSDLLLCADIFPHDQTGVAIGVTITQMQIVVDNTYDLLMRVQDTGLAADSADIDEAFGLLGDAQVN